MDNKKISDMLVKTPSTISDVIVANKYWIPVYMPNGTDSKNARIDLGETLLRLYNVINSAVSTEIQRRIDNGEIGIGGGGTPSGDSPDLTALSNQVTGLRQRVDTLENSNSWPTHYIRLIAPGKSPVDYALSTGMGVSPYTQSYPIEINTTDVDLPNFYVTLSINGAPLIDSSTRIAQITAQVTISSRQDTIQLLGGTIGTVVLSGSLSAGGTYTIGAPGVDKSAIELNSSNTSETFTVVLTSAGAIPEGSSISLVQITCEVSGVPLGKQATYVSQTGGGTATSVSGQIKLPVNGS